MNMTLETIRAAHARIAPYIVRTPLLRLPALDDALGCEVYVKAECMQRTGAFKLRGAMNKILTLTDAERARGFVAASSGNHGRAVAYAAQRFGTHACIVMPETAPAVKQAAIRALGAELVLCEASERFDVAARLCAERGATMVPPFNDEAVMAGQGTVGLEILAQCPEIDTVVVPVSGGGLIGGVATAVKALAPRVRVFGAEPAALPRYTESLRAGHPVQVEQKRSIADALVAQTPGKCVLPVRGGAHRRLCARGGCRHSPRHEAAASGGQAAVRAVVRHRHRCRAARPAPGAQGRQDLLCHQRRQRCARAAAPARGRCALTERKDPPRRTFRQKGTPRRMLSRGHYLLLASAWSMSSLSFFA